VDYEPFSLPTELTPRQPRRPAGAVSRGARFAADASLFLGTLLLVGAMFAKSSANIVMFLSLGALLVSLGVVQWVSIGRARARQRRERELMFALMNDPRR
jgi:hypothetical protein